MFTVADVNSGSAARRLATREYLPWTGLVACWVIIAIAVGHADAARLFAASAFVRSMRHLTGPSTMPALRKRLEAGPAAERQALRTAVLTEALALVAALAVLGAVIALLLATGQATTAALCGLLAAGLPARFMMPLALRGKVPNLHRLFLSWSGAVLALGAWLIEGTLVAMAVALALREWVAVALSAATGRAPPARREPAGTLSWHEIAADSHGRARRRLAYRFTKGLLSVALGPFGSLAARSGRGVRLDHRLGRFTPAQATPVALLGSATTIAAVCLILFWPKPAALIVAASLTLVGTSCGSLLIWRHLSRGAIGSADERDEDD